MEEGGVKMRYEKFKDEFVYDIHGRKVKIARSYFLMTPSNEYFKLEILDGDRVVKEEFFEFFDSLLLRISEVRLCFEEEVRRQDEELKQSLIRAGIVI